jgi:hypothetical protein
MPQYVKHAAGLAAALACAVEQGEDFAARTLTRLRVVPVDLPYKLPDGVCVCVCVCVCVSVCVCV